MQGLLQSILFLHPLFPGVSASAVSRERASDLGHFHFLCCILWGSGSTDHHFLVSVHPAGAHNWDRSLRGRWSIQLMSSYRILLTLSLFWPQTLSQPLLWETWERGLSPGLFAQISHSTESPYMYIHVGYSERMVSPCPCPGSRLLPL